MVELDKHKIEKEKMKKKGEEEEEEEDIEVEEDLEEEENIEEEIGDLLFSCVNAARHLGVNAELALKASTEKFIKRFAITEELTSADNIDMKDLSIEELDKYWDKAKLIINSEGTKND